MVDLAHAHCIRIPTEKLPQTDESNMYEYCFPEFLERVYVLKPIVSLKDVFQKVYIFFQSFLLELVFVLKLIVSLKAVSKKVYIFFQSFFRTSLCA